MASSTGRTSVLKAASDIAVHPIPHFPEFQHRDKPRHIDYALNVIHHEHKEELDDASSATVTVNTEMSELYGLRESLKKSWKKKQPQLQMKHLKKEPFHFREYIPYNVQYPHRVAVQLQRLMATTKAHLNDPSYVKTLQDRIGKDENAELLRKAHRRAKMEFDRVKQLVIDGTVDGSTLPQDLQALTAHPAYIVKQMLDRLDAYDKTPTVEKPKTKIIEVEPFEYDGNKFFKHLHTTGENDWVPKHVRQKRRRSRAKTITKTMKDAAEHIQRVRVLYKRSVSLDSETESILDMPGVEPKEMVNEAAMPDLDSIKTSSAPNKYDLPDEDGLKRFLQEQIIADAIEQKRRSEERKHQELAKEKMYDERRRQTVKWNKDLTPAPGELSIDAENRSSPSTNIEDANTSFDRLRNSFGVLGNVDAYQHKAPEDNRILKYIDMAEDANELFGNSEALNRLYAREAKFVDKFLPLLQKQLRN